MREAQPKTSEVSETSEVLAPLGQQLQGLTRALAAEVRALGDVLQRILSGERTPDLSGLPPELAEAVRGIL